MCNIYLYSMQYSQLEKIENETLCRVSSAQKKKEPEWTEFGWKNLIRCFITPCQISHYDNNPPVCWRNCGYQNPNYYHIFWNCSIIRDYWRKIHNVLEDILKREIPQEIKTIYFEYVPPEWLKRDKYLMTMPLMAGKKESQQEIVIMGESNVKCMDGNYMKEKQPHLSIINIIHLQHNGKHGLTLSCPVGLILFL